MIVCIYLTKCRFAKLISQPNFLYRREKRCEIAKPNRAHPKVYHSGPLLGLLCCKYLSKRVVLLQNHFATLFCEMGAFRNSYSAP